MHRAFLLSTLSLLLLAGGCPTASNDDDTADDDAGDDDTAALGPRIEVFPEEIDFGTVQFGTDASSSFFISSVGDEDLLVASVSMAGGYEQFDVEAFDGQQMAPGGTVSLTVLFHATAPGSAENTIHVISNDPDLPLVQIPVVVQNVID